MELQFPWPQNLFLFTVFIYIVLKLVQRKSNKNLPPGPWKLPLIGNMHQLVSSLPHHTLRDLAKKHGPLMHLQLGEISTIVVSSSEIAREVLVTNGVIFAERPSVFISDTLSYNRRDIAAAPYGSQWRQLRKICTVELLSARKVQSFQSIREDMVSDLVREIRANEGSSVNLWEKFHSLTCNITTRASFGSKCKEQDEFISFLKEFMKLPIGLCLADMYPSIKLFQVITGMKQKTERLFLKLDRVTQGIVDEHREKMAKEKSREVVSPDLVTTLLNIQDTANLEFPLTDIEIKAVIMNIFAAGTDTTATTLNWAMAEMVKHPRVLKKAQTEVRMVYNGKGNVDETCIHELKYLEAAIKETLRLHPPFPLSIQRESSEKCEINGYEIPAKTRVLVNSWAMGRDPNYWTEAEMFVPERFLDCSTNFTGTHLEFIPFGAGRRICPGINFALPTLELALAQLLYHFEWKLPKGVKLEDLDMTEEFGLTSTMKHDLVLIPTTYQHSGFK